MILIRKKASAAAPEILTERGSELTGILCEQYEHGESSFSFDSAVYGHKKVKDLLIEIQNYKCCFCESKIGHISYGDVEHFRPKAGWVQDSELINTPGYFWLAYSWDNLLLSCEICNQRYKRNYFPLINPAGRALSFSDDVDLEQPVFINPAAEDPELLISFNEEVPVAMNNNERGRQTISKLHLDRELLNEQRREKLAMVNVIYNLATGYPDTTPGLRQSALDMIQRYAEASERDETEYASMLRAFFKVNPI